MQVYILNFTTLPENGLCIEQMLSQDLKDEKKKLKLHLPLHCFIFLILFTPSNLTDKKDTAFWMIQVVQSIPAFNYTV